jgi:signal transduction histidine kinase
MYPNFGKVGAKRINAVHSGIHIDNDRLAVLVEAVFVPEEEEIDQMGVRGVETLRQLPVVVRQFDIDGNLMDQNPEAMKEFGPSKTDRKENEPCDFIRCFESEELGKKVLDEVRIKDNYSLEAEQCSLEGRKWFSIRLRRSRDPVTCVDVIIYSGRDISDIMKRAAEEADRISMERSEFFAVMAHEIRTPLHQVNGFIELLSRTILDDEQMEFMTVLQGSTNALMTIINDLLDFTKLEAGKLTLEDIPFEPRAVVNSCIAAVVPQTEEKGLNVAAHISRAVPVKLNGDPNRLRQIVSNFLSNAVKFTKKGEVATTVKRLEDDSTGRVVLRIEVKDTGMGIDDVKSKPIFNPYQQADASISRHFGGTGLGLAICDALVKAMGGTIGVESEHGKGSTFWFELPFQRYHKIVSLLQSPIKDIVEDSRCLRILLAEDNKVNQKLASAMLKRLGHTVRIVENGELAVLEIASNRQDYDVVLMDVQMPVMDVRLSCLRAYCDL